MTKQELADEYNRRKTSGLCRTFGCERQASGGSLQCPVHAARAAAYDAVKYDPAKCRTWRDANRAMGNCSDCTKPARPGGKTCEAHYRKAAKRAHERKKESTNSAPSSRRIPWNQP